MLSLWFLLAFGATLSVALIISSLRHNIAIAKRSGLPYIVTPFASSNILALILFKLWSPFVRSLLPRSCWESWIEYNTPDWAARGGHDMFARIGSDAFMLVSPGRVTLFLADAEAIRNVTSRREHFPKCVSHYGILRQFGENVLTSEGAVWRAHRRATSASFDERSAALVFAESIRQAKGLIRSWTGPQGRSSGVVKTLEQDTMRLALNIIAYVGFGLRFQGPDEAPPVNMAPELAKYGSAQPAPGHRLSFVDTMALLVKYMLVLLVVPQWILRMLPLKAAALAVEAYNEYTKYMTELLDTKMEEARQGVRETDGMDLMGQLVRSSCNPDKSNDFAALGDDDSIPQAATPSGGLSLTRDEIIGNAFIILVAGHETTSNAIHFAIIQMALNPASQRRLQREIDCLLGGVDINGDVNQDPSDWDYDDLINPMMAGMLGAVMNETLRLLPPVIHIPKVVSPERDQVLSFGGAHYPLARGTEVTIMALAAHLNPRYWPTEPSKVQPGRDDIGDFVPERWYRASVRRPESSTEGEGSPAKRPRDDEDGDEEEEATPTTSSHMFHPERGAYIPFSDGARSCLGRRIAQVEIVATLAVLFREYSVELAVDGASASGSPSAAAASPTNSMSSRPARERAYRRAQDAARDTLRQAGTRITLKLQSGAYVPVRVVRRGEEQFVNWIDS